VPTPDALKMANDAIALDPATVLYADLSDSTSLVDTKPWTFSAEVYKAFLYAAGRLIGSEGGTITSYDGDRVMGIFISDTQCDDAVRCALKINWAVKNIVQPSLKAVYKTTDYAVKHVVGIDTSKVHAARTGVRGGNDIVWVGRAPNYAAKLTAMSDSYATWITGSVFNQLTRACTHSGADPMWEPRTWTSMNSLEIHRSSYWWRVS
jgi:class 3 adenylate cyclase